MTRIHFIAAAAKPMSEGAAIIFGKMKDVQYGISYFPFMMTGTVRVPAIDWNPEGWVVPKGSGDLTRPPALCCGKPGRHARVP
jgi:hypothetical protein